jgi:opacity protein-like surface antigen
MQSQKHYTTNCEMIRGMTARTVSVVTAALVYVAHPSVAHADWTVGAFLGGAATQDTTLAINRPIDATDVTLSHVHYDSESFQSPVYYGYRVAFFPRAGWIGIEGELVHVKVVADTARTTQATGTIRGSTITAPIALSSIVEQFSITHGVNLLLANAVLRHRLNIDASGHARWLLIGRLGAGASIPHAESTIGGSHVEGYEWGAFSLQAAGGVEARVTTRLFVMTEYKLTRTVQDVIVSGGTARTPLTTHHIVAGIGLRLGRGDS